MIRTIFWNADERRLRFGWRIAGFTLLWLILTAVLNLLIAPSVATRGFTATQPIAYLGVSVGSLVATALATAVAGALLDRRPFGGYGLRLRPAWWRDLGFGLALGALLMAIVFVVELAAGWITVTGTLEAGGGMAFAGAFLSIVGAFLCIGIYEELAFRGFYLTNIAEWLGGFGAISARIAIVAATLLTALFFGVAHGLNPNASLISTINIVVAGATILSLGFLLTGDLAIPIGVHITWNLFQGPVFGFRVSGMDMGTTLIAIDQGGPAWLTGGAFGPEAGVVGLVAMLAGAWMTVLWVRRTRGSAELAQGIAAPPSREAT